MKRTSKILPYRTHEDVIVERYRKDPQGAADYLNYILEEGTQEDLMLALRDIAKAFGSVSSLANKAELNAHSLYRTLSTKGNPELKSLNKLLRAMGMRLAVQPLDKRPAQRAVRARA